ncbi:MAG: HD domain-containing protein [bacterium]|nr:HD domain-containing protein [bacterium]
MLSELISKENINNILDKFSSLSKLSFFLLDDEGNIVAQSIRDDSNIFVPAKKEYFEIINQFSINSIRTIVSKRKKYLEYAYPIVIDNVISGAILGYQEEDKSIEMPETYIQLIKDIIVQNCQKEFELNNLASEIVSNYEELTLLYEISRTLRNILDVDLVAETILKEALNILRAEKGSIMLLGENGKYLTIAASIGIEKSVAEKIRVKIGEGVAGFVAKEGNALLVEDIEKEKRVKSNKKIRYKTTSFLSTPLVCVPLKMGKETIIGVISVSDHKDGEVFTSGDLKLLYALADQAAIAIENARLFHYVKDLFLNTVASLASAIDAKDHYTKGHSEEVTMVALAIAKELKFTDEELEKIQLGALLHDIGKIGIPESILLKAEKLTSRELYIMKSHPVEGVHIMKHIKQLAEIIPAMACHHERYDGKGYPRKLKGKEIPLSGRIISVADAFSAMTSDRPYRDRITKEEAMKRIEEAKGTQFDPVVVNALVRAFRKKMFSEEK